MVRNLDREGLKSIVKDYELFFVDLWGVVHNGIKLYENAIEALNKINEEKKQYILLTNAPRPNRNIKAFLSKMGMHKNILENVYTSGEAALNYLRKNFSDKKFFHIGPPKDFDLFFDFSNQKTENINDCNYFLCTGLFDKHDEDLNYYKELLNKFISKKMICTNPDLIVDRGKKREFCAGSVAVIFEKMGGEVVYFGKPFPEVYKQSVVNNERNVLAIGDNLNTDIKGANNMNYDSMIIKNGIHKGEIEERGIEEILKNYEVKVNFMQSELKW